MSCQQNILLMRHYALLLIVFALFFSCQEAAKQKTNADSNVAQEVRKALEDCSNAVQMGGVTAEFKWLDSSADFFWIPPGFKSPLTFDSVALIMRRNAGLFRHIEEKWDLLEIQPLNNEYAVFTGRIISRTTDTANHVQEHQLVETGIMVKRSDGWKIHCGQTSLLAK
ncbi:MAG: hypothetical protein ACHQET_03285 [Chitinophagales bacterium]